MNFWWWNLLRLLTNISIQKTNSVCPSLTNQSTNWNFVYSIENWNRQERMVSSGLEPLINKGEYFNRNQPYCVPSSPWPKWYQRFSDGYKKIWRRKHWNKQKRTSKLLSNAVLLNISTLNKIWWSAFLKQDLHDLPHQEKRLRSQKIILFLKKFKKQIIFKNKAIGKKEQNMKHHWSSIE